MKTNTKEESEKIILLEEINRQRSLCSKEPNNHENIYKLGMLLYEKGDYDSAVVSLREAIRLDNKNIEYYIALAASYWRLNFPERTINTYENAHKINEKDERPLVNLGTIYYERNDFKKSSEYYLKAWKLNQSNLVTKRNLFNVLFQLREWKKLLEITTKSIELDNLTKIDWYQHGLAQAKNKEHKKAIDSYLKASKSGMKSAALASNIAESYQQINEINLADEHHLQAVEIEPENDSAWFNRGEFLYNQKRFIQAADAFQTVIKINKNDFEAWYYLARSIVKDNPEKAAQCIEVVEKNHYKGDIKYYQFSADLFQSLNRTDKVIKLRKIIQLKKPADYHNNFQLGQDLLKKGQPLEAWNSLKRCRNKSGADNKIWQQIAVNFALRKMFKEEIFCLENILKNNILSPNAWNRTMQLAIDNNVLDAFEFGQKYHDQFNVDSLNWINVIKKLFDQDHVDLAIKGIKNIFNQVAYSPNLIRRILRILKDEKNISSFVQVILDDIDLANNSELNLIALAEALELDKNSRDKEKIFETLIKTFPRSLLSLEKVVKYYLDLDETSKAINTINNSIEFIGESGRHWLLLAEVFMQRGEIKIAKKHLDKALPIARCWSNYWSLLAIIQHKEGDNKKAIESIKSGVEIAEYDSKFLYRKAIIEYNEKLYEDALQGTKKGLVVNRYDKSVWFLKGQIENCLGKKNNAKQSCLRAISLSKGHKIQKEIVNYYKNEINNK